jgi:pyridine nucleotide-disulfide oxidoreductase family protein
MARRLVLLGGGHAHVQVLVALARQRLAGAEVQLVTPQAGLVYSGMLPGLVAGHYTAAQCTLALPPLAAAAGVVMQTGTAVALDAAACRLRLADGRSVAYDLLSLDIGAVQRRDGLPGARVHASFVRPAEAFAGWLPQLQALALQRVLNLVVVGGGAAGFELALALRQRLCGDGVERARVALVTGGGEPLAGYPPAAVRAGLRQLAAQRVSVFRERALGLDAQAMQLHGGARLACDVAVMATGAEAPEWLAGSGLALDAQGFVLSGATLQSVSHANVFAAGDVATRADRPHPRSGVHAVRAGPALAVNLMRYLSGDELQPYSPPERTLNLLSCGGREAIAVWGLWVASGRWAWWWKDRIDRGFVAGLTRAA